MKFFASRARGLGCINAEWPDLYGHYREAKFTQTKHHWWWKANWGFDQLRVIKHHDGNFRSFLAPNSSDIVTQLYLRLSFSILKGMVLFLEEDHFVSTDFLNVLQLAEAERTTRYPKCDIICLGTYLEHYNNFNQEDHKTVTIMPWVSNKHNMGMAFGKSVWKKIHRCQEHFCHYDDYNWDWSLQHVSNQCLEKPMQVMLVKAPRVFHMGEW